MRDKSTATRRGAVLLSAAIVGAVLVPGAWADDHDGGRSALNRLPSFVVASSLRTTTYDGVSDDLLTAGLGKTGLASAAKWKTPSAPSKAASRISVWQISPPIIL